MYSMLFIITAEGFQALINKSLEASHLRGFSFLALTLIFNFPMTLSCCLRQRLHVFHLLSIFFSSSQLFFVSKPNFLRSLFLCKVRSCCYLLFANSLRCLIDLFLLCFPLGCHANFIAIWQLLIYKFCLSLALKTPLLFLEDRIFQIKLILST